MNRQLLTAAAVAALGVAASAHAQEPAPTGAAAAAAAQPVEADDEAYDPEDLNLVAEVIIEAAARTPRGSVPGDIAPEEVIGPAEIRSYGVSSVSELLEQLAPQLGSGQGRGGEEQVVLLNGRRISGFQEIRDIPAEAIQRTEILPEEVALKFGYAADQKVVNIVLRRFFRSTTVEAGVASPTSGGRLRGLGEIGRFSIRGDNRVTMEVEADVRSAILESERNIALESGEVDVRPFRTLSGSQRQIEANGVLARALGDGFTGTINGTLEGTRSESRRGLALATVTPPGGTPITRAAPIFGPLLQRSDTWTARLAGGLNGEVWDDWRLSLNGSYVHSDSLTRTDTGIDATAFQARVSAGADPLAPLDAPFVFERGRDKGAFQSDALQGVAVISGTPFDAPAGDVATTFRLGGTQTWFGSQTLRSGIVREVDFTRRDLNAQANVDVPLARKRADVLPFLGDLTFNANFAVNDLSDFGTLTRMGYGITWRPVERLSIIASRSHDEGAPSVQQVGNPEIRTPGSRVFDFRTGRTVEVTRIEGGNPDLLGDDRVVEKLQVNWQPWESQDLRLNAQYTRTRIDNPIQNFPAVTPEIEAAFEGEDRFIRNAAGELVQVDFRPINFFESRREQLRWGFTYSRPFGPQPQRGPGGRGPGGGPRGQRAAPGGGQDAPTPAQPGGQAAAPAAGAQPGAPAEAPRPPGGFRRPDGEGPPGGFRGPPGGFGPGGGRGFRGGGGRFGGGGPPGGGRLMLAVFNTLTFEDELVVRRGGPVFDRLNGSSAGSLGGTPDQQWQVQAGVTRNGLGAQFTGEWRSATTVLGGLGSAVGDLRFDDFGTVNLRLFANFGQMRELVRDRPWLRGARVTLQVTNLLDSKPKVRDTAGRVPISYQPDDLDPIGREVRLTFRKLLF